ncbi:MAG: type II toxin-antitoxin system RelE/ParE family toxin [Vicingaceae bacterium]
MAERTVSWSISASRQLRHVLEFWIKKNGSRTYSLKLLNQIEANLEQVKKYPKKCPESVYPEVRVAAMGHYSIYYRFTPSSIRIEAFWDNRQDPKQLKKIIRNMA